MRFIRRHCHNLEWRSNHSSIKQVPYICGVNYCIRSLIPRYKLWTPSEDRVSSVQSLSHVWLFVTPWTAAHQASLSIPTPRVYSNSCPSRRWCHPTISCSVIPFSSCLHSFPTLGSVSMSEFFTSGGQSIGVSASTSVFQMNIQDWFPLGWTGWISLQSKRLSGVFSNTTVQSINSLVLSFLYSPISIHEYWKNHSLD